MKDLTYKVNGCCLGLDACPTLFGRKRPERQAAHFDVELSVEVGIDGDTAARRFCQELATHEGVEVAPGGHFQRGRSNHEVAFGIVDTDYDADEGLLAVHKHVVEAERCFALVRGTDFAVETDTCGGVDGLVVEEAVDGGHEAGVVEADVVETEVYRLRITVLGISICRTGRCPVGLQELFCPLLFLRDKFLQVCREKFYLCQGALHGHVDGVGRGYVGAGLHLAFYHSSEGIAQVCASRVGRLQGDFPEVPGVVETVQTLSAHKVGPNGQAIVSYGKFGRKDAIVVVRTYFAKVCAGKYGHVRRLSRGQQGIGSQAEAQGAEGVGDGAEGIGLGAPAQEVHVVRCQQRAEAQTQAGSCCRRRFGHLMHIARGEQSRHSRQADKQGEEQSM